MLWKTLEFKTLSGQKVKVMEIPVLEEDPLLQLLIKEHLQSFIYTINQRNQPNHCYSFNEYLKKTLKWNIYERLIHESPLPYHA
ncbi:uncharacterized protein DUF2535 [Bacillus oleivorans]|uniref:Uncharacterized protein DUF2535 n=1 Tax=Bacillus oleivorans TaxID=1448271 RepID=A0A285CMK5_9BACI|nr:DUF2535 family protein [Bacillus oleivorans]SNX68286.1 uncharacterized protein DUF2535 [Bacillus oleivorans]